MLAYLQLSSRRSGTEGHLKSDKTMVEDEMELWTRQSLNPRALAEAHYQS